MQFDWQSYQNIDLYSIATTIFGVVGVVLLLIGTNQHHIFRRKTIRQLEAVDKAFSDYLKENYSKYGSVEMLREKFGAEGFKIYIKLRKEANLKATAFMLIGFSMTFIAMFVGYNSV